MQDQTDSFRTLRIEVPDMLLKSIEAHQEYNESYSTITEDEIKELPSGTLLYPSSRKLYRTIAGQNALKLHLQLVHYPQPLLGGISTADYLTLIKECSEDRHSMYLQFKEYITEHFLWLCEYFPYGFQVAYDIHTNMQISDRSRELEKRVAARYQSLTANQ